ncbi:hypothetical protein K9N68_34415 (plasmid) [Kovacikia minuta CCNUW1]|uniref:hypothetical protein n=1 Tax=Kovacikia minuta TaxID=2931930 RepID=UPI001CCBA7E1|nr:hypothetical protein [Kovacikia minuta]UBF30310.1 hypothetical protein K9N68_34415 [Kovacikia minuta CCNUW1]
MSEKGKFDQFLPNDDEKLDRDKLSIEVPAEQRPVQHDRIPSGYDPMGEIHLRGRVSQGLAGGRIPWWVLIAGWIIFGGTALLMLYAAVTSSTATVWLMFAIAVIPLVLLWKGTTAKLSKKRRR